MTHFNEVVEEEKKVFWAKNGNPDTLSSISQFHPDIQGRLPQVIDEAITQAMHKAALAVVEEVIVELENDMEVIVIEQDRLLERNEEGDDFKRSAHTRDYAMLKHTLNEFTTLRKQLTDKE